MYAERGRSVADRVEKGAREQAEEEEAKEEEEDDDDEGKESHDASANVRSEGGHFELRVHHRRFG